MRGIRREEPSRKHLDAYWTNMLRRMRRMAPDPTLTGRCALCGRKKILAYELVHRGPARPTNLLCNKCFDGGKRK